MTCSNDDANTTRGDHSFDAELAGDDFTSLQTRSTVHVKYGSPTLRGLSTYWTRLISKSVSFLRGLGNGIIHKRDAAQATYLHATERESSKMLL